MRKLSVVKERRSQNENDQKKPGDIRGLEDPQLFKASGFEGRLYLKHEGEIRNLDHVTTKYSLEVGPLEGHSNVHKMQSVWRQPGEHKLQGLRLYFAALELAAHNAGLHGLLTFESGLQKQLKDRIGKEVHTHDEQELRTWLKHGQNFTLSQGVALTLKQAGYPIATDKPHVTLHWTEARHLTTQGHVEQKQHTEKLRKRA